MNINDKYDNDYEYEYIELDDMCRIRGFDEDVVFLMNNNTEKPIKDIQAGDILYNNVIVTAKIVITSYTAKLYQVGDLVITGNYYMKYNSNWITIENHPESVPLEEYKKSFLYGINTSNKKIFIDNFELCDWDHIYDETLKIACDYSNKLGEIINPKKFMTLNIHKYLDIGFFGDTEIYLKTNTTKTIIDVEIGDELFIGGLIYGKVEIETLLLENSMKYLGTINSASLNNISNKIYHLLVTHQFFWIDGNIVGDYNHAVNYLSKTYS